jgi:hypothetical protein
MKVWHVTRSYYDWGHDHGYYDYGIYATIEAAKKAAEIVAEHMVNEHDRYIESSKWKDPKGAWKWLDENIIEISTGDEYCSINVTEKYLLNEPNEDIVNTKPTITYT